MSVETANKPLICLLPGLGGSGALFRWLIDALGDDYDTTVIVYGDGRCLDDFVEFAVQQIPADRVVYLVAESFSGPVAIKLLASAELDVAGCTLCNTFATPPYARLLPVVDLLPASMLAASRFSGAILRWWVGGGLFHATASQSEKWDVIMQSIDSQDRKKLHSQLRALRDFDVTALLPTIDVSVLYLQGSADRLIRRVHGRRLAARLKRCRVATVSGPHLLLQLSAPECARLIRQEITNGKRSDY